MQPDEYDAISIHFLAVERTTREAVGVARYRPDVGKLGRLAVLKSGRGHGLGGELVRAVERYARDVAGLDSLKLEAQTRVMPFYAALGYVAEGEDFDVSSAGRLRLTMAGRRRAPSAHAQVAADTSTRNIALCKKSSRPAT